MRPDYFSLRRTVIRLCGGKCSDGRYCGGGTSDDSLLTVDHIHGDGVDAAKKHERRSGRRNSTPPSARMKEWQAAIDGGYLTQKYQVFCWNCHWKKTLENKDGKERPLSARRDHLPLFDGPEEPIYEPVSPRTRQIDWEAQMRIAAAANDIFDKGNVDEKV